MTAPAAHLEDEDVANQIPDEMRIYAGVQCPNPAEFGIRGTDLWVLFAEDDHPYRPRHRSITGNPSREAALEAITAALYALEGARDRLLRLPVLRERL